MSSDTYSIGIAFYCFSSANDKQCLVRALEYASPRVHSGVVFFVNNQILPYDVSAWVGRQCGASMIGCIQPNTNKLHVFMQDVFVFPVTYALFCGIYRCIANSSQAQSPTENALPSAGIPYPSVLGIISRHVLSRVRLGVLVPTPQDKIQCAQYCLSVLCYLLRNNSGTSDPALLAPLAALQAWGHGLSPQQLYQTMLRVCSYATVLSESMPVRLYGANVSLPVSQLCLNSPGQLTLMYDCATLQSNNACL